MVEGERVNAHETPDIRPSHLPRPLLPSPNQPDVRERIWMGWGARITDAHARYVYSVLCDGLFPSISVDTHRHPQSRNCYRRISSSVLSLVPHSSCLVTLEYTPPRKYDARLPD